MSNANTWGIVKFKETNGIITITATGISLGVLSGTGSLTAGDVIFASISSGQNSFIATRDGISVAADITSLSSVTAVNVYSQSLASGGTANYNYYIAKNNVIVGSDTLPQLLGIVTINTADVKTNSKIFLQPTTFSAGGGAAYNLTPGDIVNGVSFSVSGENLGRDCDFNWYIWNID